MIPDHMLHILMTGSFVRLVGAFKNDNFNLIIVFLNHDHLLSHFVDIAQATYIKWIKYDTG